jgi:flagella basal body P-ring formation protein FlgA
MKMESNIKWGLIAVIVSVLSLFQYSSLLAMTTVRVMEKAQVGSKQVSLGDIADIKGDDHQLVEQLQSVVLGKSPLPGEAKKISGHYIESRVRHSNIDTSAISFHVPENIQVVSEAIEISSHKIEEMVKHFILKKVPGDPEQASIKILDAKSIALPKGNITYEVVPRKREGYLGVTNLLVVFMVNGAVEKRLRVTVQIEVSKEVVISAHPLKRHTIITQEDIRLEKRNLAELTPDVMTNPLEVIGKRTRRGIDPNTPLKHNFIEVAPLVKRGDLVTILAETDALKITTQGVVVENGCRGEIVKVINTGSRKEVFARVIDAKTVEVEF